VFICGYLWLLGRPRDFQGNNAYSKQIKRKELTLPTRKLE